jgi:hypothetical protein
MSNSDKIRSAISDYLKSKNGVLVRRRDLISAMEKLGFSLGAIRGVLYRFTNEGKNIKFVRLIKTNGSVYFYYNDNDLDVLRIEIDKFITNLKLLDINFNANSYNKKDSDYLSLYLMILLDLIKTRKEDKRRQKVIEK